jgi:RimJ/RimL family protein N-acetyltransferase
MSEVSTQSFSELTLQLDDVILRPLERGDINAVVEACSDPLTQRWLPLPNPYTVADAEFFVDTAETFRSSGEGLRCVIARAEDNVLIGMVSVKATDWRERVTDVGYWCRPGHRGHGHITRATRALSLYVLEQGMQRVELRAATGNAHSNRVAAGAGFSFEGVLRNAASTHSGRVDLNLYSLILADRGMAAG